MSAPYRVGGLTLEALLGQGAGGEVWRARSADGVTALALKRVRGEGTAAELAEVRAAARLDHPRIVRVLDVGTVGAGDHTPEGWRPGEVWISMELCSGGTARERPPQGWAAVRGLLLALLDGLGHAHAHGIVHRDVKASNLMWATAADPSPGWRLGDLGVAWLREAAGAPRTAGTLSYMSPEQLSGRAVDHGPWTDLYAVGCLIHVLLTGRPPFVGEDVIRQHLHRAPPPLMAGPPGLASLTSTLLEKSPLARPQTAAHARALLLALERGDHTTASAALDDETIDGTLDVSPLVAAEAHPRALTVTRLPVPERPPEVIAELPPAPSTGAAALPLRVPRLIGQRAPREALWRALRLADSSDSAVGVALVGQSGVGTSRLARWLAVAAHEAAGAWTARLEGGADAEAALVSAALRLGAAPSMHAVEHLRSQLGLSAAEAEEAWRWLSGEAVGDALWRRALVSRAAAAAGAPVVVVVDAPTSETPLEAIRRALPGAAVVVVSLARAALAPPRWTQVAVTPLSELEVARLVTEHVGLAPELAGGLAARSHGLPGAAMAILRGLVESGALVATPTGYRLSSEASWSDHGGEHPREQAGEGLDLLAAARALLVNGAPRAGLHLMATHARALALSGAAPAERLEARGIHTLGLVRVGHAREAEAAARAILAEAEALGDPVAAGRAELVLATVLRQRGALSEAIARFERALPLLRGLDDHSVGRARLAWLSALRLAGDPARSEAEARSLLHDLSPYAALESWDAIRASTSLQLAAACGAQGRWREQERHARGALETFRALRFRNGEAQCLNALAEGARHAGELDAAEGWYREAIALLEAAGLVGAVVSWLNLGLVQLLRGDDGAAGESLGRVLRDAARSQRSVYGGAAALGLACVRARAGDAAGYRSYRSQAEVLLAGTGFSEPDLKLLERMAEEAWQRLESGSG